MARSGGSMVPGPLSTAQVDEFIERGWTLLRHAFALTVARAVRHDLGRRIWIDLERPQEWTQPEVWLQETLTEPPYTDALTDRFHSAVDQIVGQRSSISQKTSTSAPFVTTIASIRGRTRGAGDEGLP